MSGFREEVKIKFRHLVWCQAPGEEEEGVGTVSAAWGPREMKTTQGGSAKTLLSYLAHHPEISLGPPAARPFATPGPSAVVVVSGGH